VSGWLLARDSELLVVDVPAGQAPQRRGMGSWMDLPLHAGTFSDLTSNHAPARRTRCVCDLSLDAGAS
jgi:hypothetical protein